MNVPQTGSFLSSPPVGGEEEGGREEAPARVGEVSDSPAKPFVMIPMIDRTTLITSMNPIRYRRARNI
jgi:hypothetical protein